MELTRFSIRSSGRDLTKVRRTDRATQARKSGVVPLADLKKAELVTLAEARGVDTSGTKADLAERLESNDAEVATDG